MLPWQSVSTASRADAPGQSDAAQGVETVNLLSILPWHIDVAMTVQLVVLLIMDED